MKLEILILSLIFNPTPLFYSNRNDSSINFMVFFFIFFVQLVVSVCWALGLTSGSCGLITLTQHLDKGPLVTFFLIFVTFVLILYAFASLLMLIQVSSVQFHYFVGSQQSAN